MTEPSQPLFLFGSGYCALALAGLWDGPVFGTYRSEESRSRIETKGISGVAVGDVEGLSKAIAGAHIVISTPPGEAGCPALGLIGQVAHKAASVTYLSTTGVYGDLDGGWVFEWTAVNPGSVRGQRRVEAEQGWRTVRADVRIVRLPGIYGPGRSPLDRVRSGRATRIIKPGQVFSRAHRDDIASGVKALIDAGVNGTFNLCDEEAAPPQDVTAYAYDLLELPVPEGVPIEQAELSEMGRSFYAECKRVSNAKLKAATGWRPLYPNYREGLQTILAAEQS